MKNKTVKERMEKLIPIVYGLNVLDKNDIQRTVTIGINPENIADVYVYFTDKDWPRIMSICDDTIFIKNIFKFFKMLGYKGPYFDRAESGMQGKDYIVLEPNDQFTKFATEKYGFNKRSKI